MSLSERLREIANGRYHTSISDDLSEAATTIDTQAAEIERLRGELAEAHLTLDRFGQARTEGDDDLTLASRIVNLEADRLAAEAPLAEAVRVFEQLSDCPFLIDAATVPKGKQPFEAPDQVIGSLVITGRHYQAIRDFITKHGGERE